MVCMTHCRKDLTCNLWLEDDALSSYTFRHWGEHFKVGSVMGDVFMKARVDFVLELCQERQLANREPHIYGIDDEHNNDPTNPNPEYGLRAGYNACLMVIFLDVRATFGHWRVAQV